MTKTIVHVSKVATLAVNKNLFSTIDKTGEKIKILHLEDVSSDARLVNNQLKKSKLDYEVLVVDTKDKFIKELKDNSPDIILADHSLPSFNSHQALAILHESGLTIPFILVTATMSDELAVDLIRKGADDYILKDRLNRLPSAIENALETYGLKRNKEVILNELLSSELHLKEAQAVAKLGSWETDLQTSNVQWSEETHHIFETDTKKFKATHEAFLSFIHPDDRNEVNIAFQNSYSSQAVNSIEHRIIATNGAVKHVLENWKIFHDDKGHPVRAVGTCQDITERKIAAEEITKLSLVARKTSNSIVITDTEEKIQWVNEAFTQMTGYKLNEVIGKKPGTFLQGNETNPVTVGYMRKKISHSEAFSCDIINYSKSGNKYWNRIQCQPQFDSTGKLTSFFSIQTDITKEKEAEEKVIKLNEEIAKSEKFFKAVIESSDDMITIIDATGKTIYASPAVSRKFGYTPAECLTLKLTDVVHPDDAVIMQEFVGKIMKHPGVPMECPLIRDRIKDGSYIWVEGTLTNFLETEGINAIVANFRDVTERKKTDEENRFKANLLNTIGQAAIATDLNGVINYWNRAAEDIYGWTKEEALGKNIMDLTPADAAIEKAIQVMEGLKRGRPWSGEFEARKKDGTNFPAMVTNTPIYDGHNRLSGIIGISADITEKKKLEDLLNKTNQLATIGSWEIDVVKGTVFCSDIAKEICEVGSDFIPQSNTGINYLKDGNDQEIISRRVEDCIEKGIAWDEELEVTTHNGNTKWVRTIGEGEFLHGKCVRVYGSFQNINARKKAELEALKAYEEKNIILESIGDGFYSLDNNWIITYWNYQAEKITGKSKQEMLGKNFWEAFPETIDTPAYAAYFKAIQENTIQHFERFSERFEGWYQFSVYPSANGLSVYFQDVTERQMGEQQIKADKTLLRTLIDHLPDTIYYKDKSAKKLISNKFDYTVLGADTEQEVLGKTDMEISSHANALMTYTQDMEILNTGNPLINFEEYFITADNKPLWLLTTKVPLRNEDNEIIGLLGIGRNITQRKIAEDKLIELNAVLENNIKQLVISNKELEEFAYVASHDLQEPLRMVTGFLGQIEKKYCDVLDDKGKQYIHFAIDGAKRMRQIILDLLEFSRVGRIEDTELFIDLNDMMREVVVLCQHQIKETKAIVRFENLPSLATYKTPLRQVFQNLVSNALRYHIKGIAPIINVSAVENETHWQFAISDNGIGIDEEYFDKIFVIFQRLHNKDEFSGTGIGLAICKKIIENMGGKIWVESAQGKGSTFYFTIKKINS